MRYIRLLALILSLNSIFTVEPAGDGRQYDRWTDIPSAILFEKGNDCMDNNSDSAMIFYSLVESRYDSKMDRKDKLLCVDALIRKWQIMYYRNYDFAAAYEYLSKAQEIAEDEGLVLPSINLRLGILYQTIYEQCNDTRAGLVAFYNYRKGFRDALEIGDTAVIDVTASNLAHLAFLIDSLDVIKEDWKVYSRSCYNDNNMKYYYNIRMFEGLSLVSKGRYDGAVAIFDSLIGYLQTHGANVRYRLCAYLNKVIVLMAERKYEEAINVLMAQLKVAELRSIKDLRIEIYGKLAECYYQLGKPVIAMEYENKELRLTDSLVNYSQLSRLEEVKAGRNLRKYQERLAVIEAQRKMQRVVTIVIAIFLVVVCGLLVVLFNRNRRLNQSNKVLYDKNIDILRQSEKELEVRKEYERRLEEMAARETATPENSPVEKKYKGSRLDDADKTVLINAVLGVMGTTDEYLQPDFSIERLAELAGSKSKLVSQVINERQGCNFNSFVNEFRILEACRRIRDINRYGKLTLDAISKSVGFRARSSFFTAFKAVTGLTPSEFQKIARSEHKM